MRRQLAWLAGQLAATLALASMLIFALLRVMPGDAATVALGMHASDEALAAWREANGTDRPLIVQYGSWIGSMFRGDFGRSFVTGNDITPLVLDRLAVTVILVVLALMLALAVAIPLGTLAAVHHRRAIGPLIAGGSQIGVAIPSFLVGVMLVSIVSVRLRLLPAIGWVPPAVDFLAFLRHVTLPVIALATVQAAIITRYVRSAVLEVMREDFLRTARAGGLTRGRALVRHGLRNAGVPIVTVVGVQFASMLVGAVVIERVFVVPGLGSLLVDAVQQRDLQSVQSIVLLLVVVVVVLNFLVDLLYTLLDPRLRLAEEVA